MPADVSIVIPCYNDGPWIADAVRASLQQTVRAKEVIVVDDGSTDDSVRVVEGFGAEVKLIRSPHLGGSAARNLGWRQASGEWIQFLDADDLIAPCKLERHLPLAQAAGPKQITFCRARVIDLKSGELRYETEHAEQAHPFSRVCQETITPMMPIYSRRCLEEVGGFREGLPGAQDRDLNCRLWLAGYNFQPVPAFWASIRKRSGSVSSATVKLLACLPVIYEEIIRGEKDVVRSPEVRRLAATVFSHAARRVWAKGEGNLARRLHRIGLELDEAAALAVYGRVTGMLARLGGVGLGNAPLTWFRALGGKNE
jgi:glycosyltransferase involved in cell wall biosynthesis